jgi:acyl carrier protein
MANPFLTRERIETEVRQALATTLRRDPASIPLDASILKSIGATSIDMLDVNFRLESAFGIRLATQLVLDHVEEELGEGTAVGRDDRITEAAAALLRGYLGDLPGLKAGIYAEEVPGLVTPEVLVKSVEAIAGHLPELCTHCGQSSWGSPDGAKVVCSACGKPAQYPDGDELTRQWIRDFERDHHVFTRA